MKTSYKATIWKVSATGLRFIGSERGDFATALIAKLWAGERATALNAHAEPGYSFEYTIGEEIEELDAALAHLKAVVAAYREPHYGDKDTQLDNVHTAVEAAEIWLKETGA